MYGTGKYNQDLTASAEFIEHAWDKHPELLASNGGPTLRKASFYEDEDGNISQNPYYHHQESLVGGGTNLGDLDRHGTLKHVKMLKT